MNDNNIPSTIINDLYRGWAGNKMDILKLQKSIIKLDLKVTILTIAAVTYLAVKHKQKKKVGDQTPDA